MSTSAETRTSFWAAASDYVKRHGKNYLLSTAAYGASGYVVGKILGQVAGVVVRSMDLPVSPLMEEGLNRGLAQCCAFVAGAKGIKATYDQFGLGRFYTVPVNYFDISEVSYTRKSASYELQRAVFDFAQNYEVPLALPDSVFVMKHHGQMDAFENMADFLKVWMHVRALNKAGVAKGKEKFRARKGDEFVFLSFLQHSKYVPQILSTVKAETVAALFEAELVEKKKGEASIYQATTMSVVDKNASAEDRTCPFLESVAFLQENKPELLRAITPELANSIADKLIEKMPYLRAKGVEAPIEKNLKDARLVETTANLDTDSGRFVAKSANQCFLENAVAVFEANPSWKQAADKLAKELLYVRREELAAVAKGRVQNRFVFGKAYESADRTKLKSGIQNINNLKKRFPALVPVR